MSDLDQLHSSLGLHSRIEIIYIVDCYEATLYCDDDLHVEAIGTGDSIQDAIEDLELHLQRRKDTQ